ncbi:MAG: hypothetical protein AMXMBFR47_17350 [Planctomycetota bacterium]
MYVSSRNCLGVSDAGRIFDALGRGIRPLLGQVGAQSAKYDGRERSAGRPSDLRLLPHDRRVKFRVPAHTPGRTQFPQTPRQPEDRPLVHGSRSQIKDTRTRVVHFPLKISPRSRDAQRPTVEFPIRDHLALLCEHG